jgi:hypothetical protein
MRQAVWKWARRGVPEGQIMPLWLMMVRAALYPIEFLQWRIGKWHGWQYESDTYRIYGVTYSMAGLRALSEADGELYRITRRGEVVIVEQVHNAKVAGREPKE